MIPSGAGPPRRKNARESRTSSAPRVSAAAHAKTRTARETSASVAARPSPRRYAPRLASVRPSAPAMAAIVSPALGLAVRAPSRHSTRTAARAFSPAMAAAATSPRSESSSERTAPSMSGAAIPRRAASAVITSPPSAAAPATASVSTAPPTSSRPRPPRQSPRRPTPSAPPIHATGCSRFGGSPNSRSSATATASAAAASATEPNAEAGTHTEIRSRPGQARRHGGVEREILRESPDDARLHAEPVAPLARVARGEGQLDEAAEPTEQTPGQRGGRPRLDEVTTRPALADEHGAGVDVEREIRRQTEGGEEQEAGVDLARADRLLRGGQFDERIQRERRPPCALGRREEAILQP